MAGLATLSADETAFYRSLATEDPFPARYAYARKHRSRPVVYDLFFQEATSGLTNTVAENPDEVAADWKITIESLIDELSNLQAGWDGFAAPQIDTEIASSAKALASRLAVPGSPAPSVVPTINGTVQLEWHTLRYDAEVEIVEDGRYKVFTLPVAQAPWEAEVEVDEAVRRLIELLRD
ncbi:MAG: hypothetical protein HYV04_09070 [Deltaproteobacteria bacterium]|nr:hypothetical protein [Deltaproteobacteria bacterium]